MPGPLDPDLYVIIGPTILSKIKLSDQPKGDKGKGNLSNLLNSFVIFVLMLDNSTSFDINYLYSSFV